MYQNFYGLHDRPFNMTPDSRFFYSSTKHEEALNCLLLAISERNGFVVITGEIGSGKTTVCRTLINKLDQTTKVALILNTHLGKKELLTTILEDLGIEYRSTSKTHLLAALNEYLLEQTSKDVNVVVIIDEAQNLAPSVLEEVRMLSNLETETEKLLQIVLLGQPELKKKLALPKLEQFRQRVVFHYHLEPLSREETKEYIKHRLKKAGNEKAYIIDFEYIKHRLKKAGNETADIFDDEAINEIYVHSKGVPRLINVMCHNALITGLVYESKRVTRSIALEAIAEATNGLGSSQPVKESHESDTDAIIRNLQKESSLLT